MDTQETLAVEGAKSDETGGAERVFFAHSPDLLAVVGADGYFKLINPAFHAILGYNEAELFAKPVIEFLHPEDVERTRQGIKILAAGEQRMGSRNRYRCKDGSYRWFSWNTNPIAGSFYTIGRDISDQVASEERIRELNRQLEHQNENLERSIQERLAELKRSEAQVLQLQKMDAIGRLAGSVAHDFNNMLAAVMMTCELLAEDASKPHAVLEHVKSIQEASERAAALTRQLLMFSRKQLVQFQTIELNPIIANLEKMLVRLIGENMSITLKLAPDLKPISGDPTQMEQVILNLVVNARDAMPTGGQITIATENTFLDEIFTSKHLSVKSGNYVMMTVSDEGLGMDNETVAKIFEPFFTTKPAHKGTGLGLTTTYGIIKQSNGTIWVYSEPGLGTVFKIYLPVADAEIPIQIAAPAVVAQTSGMQTILLVEDDKSLRSTFSAMLRNKGYTLLAANGGKEALDLLAQPGAGIDLLLTDIMMPDMNGFDLAKKALAAHPNLKVLYMSGYADDALGAYGVDHPETLQFIQKPFGMNALIAKIAAMLPDSKKAP